MFEIKNKKIIIKYIQYKKENRNKYQFALINQRDKQTMTNLWKSSLSGTLQ